MVFFFIMGFIIIVLIWLSIEGHLKKMREQNKEMIQLLKEINEKKRN